MYYIGKYLVQTTLSHQGGPFYARTKVFCTMNTRREFTGLLIQPVVNSHEINDRIND